MGSEIVQLEGHWWQPQGWLSGVVTLDSSSGAVAAVGSPMLIADVVESDVPNAAPTYIPAPIDLHVHGGGGQDVMMGDEAVYAMLRAHAQSGCGALLATSVTASSADTTEFLQSVQRVMAAPRAGSAVLLGAHLEGPYINPDKLGAQPPFARAVDQKQLRQWFSTGVVRVITFAPEMDAEDSVLKLCADFSVKAQIGHSLCDWAEAKIQLEKGCGITHLYNAMSGLDHRSGGVALAALAYGDYAEVITDGIHFSRSAFDLARKSIPNLYSVTDATAASGMPDGEYRLGSLTVYKKNGCVQLQDGTLAGSCLTQLKSISVLRSWGVSWHDVAKMTSAIPAAWIRNEHYGNIQPGMAAQWLELDNDAIVALWINGQRQEISTCNVA